MFQVFVANLEKCVPKYITFFNSEEKSTNLVSKLEEIWGLAYIQY